MLSHLQVHDSSNVGKRNDRLVLVRKSKLADLDALDAFALEHRDATIVECDSTDFALFPDRLRGFGIVPIRAGPER